MPAEYFVSITELLIKALQALVWPALVLFVLVRFGGAFQRFLEDLGELSFKAPGVEASAKRQIEAAALLGAAEAARPADRQGRPDEQARSIAEILSAAGAPRAARRLFNASILWVDDRPDNNTYEREALEALGIRFTLATSTEEALRKLEGRRFGAIISDMGRPPDPRAGYTLLEEIKKFGSHPPFIIYAASAAPHHKAETRKRGGWGTTNRPRELFDLVLSALLSRS